MTGPVGPTLHGTAMGRLMAALHRAVQIQDGLLVTTTDGTVIELNDAFTVLVRYGADCLPCLVPHPWWPDAELEPDAFAQVNAALSTAQTNGEGRFVVPLRHRDGSVAITLQRSILGPTDLPPGFAVRYEPAARQLEVGDDWYDVVSLGGSCVGVVVGDCVGRGPGAAAVMGQLRSACRALLLQPHHPPGQVLPALDDFAELIPEAHCTILFCATIDLSTATVRYRSAGHPPGLLVHADGSSEVLDVAQSVPLATMPEPRRPEVCVTLRPGSTLLLYTDGLIENRREPLAGTLLGDGHEDDVAYVSYQHPRSEPEPFSAVLPAEPGRLGPLRRALQAWLATTVAAAGCIDEILLAVSEACANAIEHAGGGDPGRVATVTGTATAAQIELQITDYGRWKSPAADPGDRGRGLLLMNRMMDDVTISTDDSGTTVRLRKGL